MGEVAAMPIQVTEEVGLILAPTYFYSTNRSH